MKQAGPFSLENFMHPERGPPPTPRATDVEVMELRAALAAWRAEHRFEVGQIVRYKKTLEDPDLQHTVPTGLFIVLEVYDDEEAQERPRWHAQPGVRRDIRVGCFFASGEFQMSFCDSRMYELAPGEVLT